MSSWPYYSQDEIEAVAAVLRSGQPNYWGGEEGLAFEQEFAEYHGVPHAVAVANGSVALELALFALGVGEGDEVVVTPRSFMASASSIVLRGARPVFADVDPESQNITPDTVTAVITPRTRAIIAVHLAGWPCDMHGLVSLCRERGLYLIEDCAQAHGATLDGRLVGGFGDAAAFSFCTDKIMSTGGEGGMVLFQDDAVWHRAWSYKDHGKSWDAVHNRKHRPGFRWLHESFGTNWRMTEMQAAIGRIQLRKLDDWVRIRRQNAAVLFNRFSEADILRVPWPEEGVGHAFYRYYAFVRSERLPEGWSRDSMLIAITEAGIPCSVGSCSEIYLEKAFEVAGLQPLERLPVARELGETSLAFPAHPTLSETDLDRMAGRVMDIIQNAAAIRGGRL